MARGPMDGGQRHEARGEAEGNRAGGRPPPALARGRASRWPSSADPPRLAGTACLLAIVAIVALNAAGVFERSTPPARGVAPAATPAASPRPPTRATRPPQAGRAAVAASSATPAAAGPVICLDPGHGGEDLGTVHAADGKVPTLYEKALTLEFAQDLAGRLRADGFRVVLTRTGDTQVNARDLDVNGDGVVGQNGVSDELDDLQARINVCNAAHAALLISMHFDGSDQTALRGHEVWFTQDRAFGDQNQRFAELLNSEFNEQMGAAGYTGPDRGAHNDSTDDDRQGRFPHMVITGPAVPGYVTPSEMPGVIGEPLFITNDADAAFVLSRAGHDAIVTAYERAVLGFFHRG